MFRPIALIPLAFCTVAAASDWPQWRGPSRTGQVPAGEYVPSKLAAEPHIVWRIAIGEGFASPVIAAGTVFYLDNQEAQEVAHAVDAATGKELWRATIFSSHRDGFGIGPRCAPTVDGDRVYVQATKGALRCLSTADGKVSWQTNYVDDLGAIYIGEKGKASGASRHGANGSPLIEGDRLFVQAGGLNGASIVAFNKMDGTVIWKSQSDQTAYAAPFMAESCGKRQLISFTAEALIGLDPADGKLLWRHPLKTALGRHVTTPVVWKDIVVVGSHQIGLVGIKIARSGDEFAASEGWVTKDAAMNFSTPVLTGDHLYGLGPNKNILCIDPATGQIQWEKTGLIITSADKAEASFLIMGGNILMLSDSGELALFAADPHEYREISRVQVCGNTWCNPAYADGRLYLRDAHELMCVDLRD